MDSVILTLRIPKDQKEAIEEAAWRKRISVNKLLAPVIKNFVKKNNTGGTK